MVVLPYQFVDDQLIHHAHQFSDLRWQSVPYFLEEVVDEPEIIPVRHDVLPDLGQERPHLFGFDDWHGDGADHDLQGVDKATTVQVIGVLFTVLLEVLVHQNEVVIVSEVDLVLQQL